MAARGASSVRFHQVHCVLDDQYRLLWVGGDWDDFALANGGRSAKANEVLSTSLFAHILDASTRRAMTVVIEAVREARLPLKVDYRCDSPTVLRRFQLTIQPMKENRVLLVHDLRDARSFERPLTAWTYDPDATEVKCSFCCAVQHGSDWIAPEDLETPHPAVVRYRLCPACEAGIDEAVVRLRDAAATPGTS